MTGPSLRVFVNRAGGAAAAAGEGLRDTLEAAFAKAGVAADIQLLDGCDIADAVRDAATRAARIVVAGGDGTIACAAAALEGSDAELAVLPLGTLNHLARDLGVPAALDAAAALAATGTASAIDVGTINGRRFVNNVSIGLYPQMVRRREDARKRHGIPKWLATVPAAWASLARLPHHHLFVDIGKGERALTTPLLFIGNNRYALDAGQVGTRGTLTDGKLSVYAVARQSRRSLIWFALRAMAGRARPADDFCTVGECETLSVRWNGGPMNIAMDGEVEKFASPLVFRVERGGLRVVVPVSA